MQMKHTATPIVLILIALTEGLTINEPEEDTKAIPSAPTSDCQVTRNGNGYSVGGDACTEFDKSLPIDGISLLIEGSHIMQIKYGDFDYLCHLKYLEINMNAYLQEIGNGAFSNMSLLENLTITNNAQLMYIYPGSFSGLVNLQHLVLSKNAFMDFYYISQVVRSDNLPSLITLDASGNAFRSINHKDAYHMDISTLEVLRLSSCSINEIEGTAFNNLPRLRVLYVDNNNLPTNSILNLITNISRSSNGFSEMHVGANTIPDPNCILNHVRDTNISLIDLSYSRFAPVIADAQYSLPSITHLDLSVTRSRLPESYFISDRFPNIKYLLLGSNFLLGRRFYMSLPKLVHLDLSNNVDSHAYDSIFTAGFDLKNMTSLQVLRLDSNPITFLEQGSMPNLPKLKELYLVNTSLESIGEKSFGGFRNLEILDLSQNFFLRSTTINNTTFTGLDNLKSLILDNCMLTCISDHNTFIRTPQLQILSLRQNSLLELKNDLLHHVPLLKSLDLSYNSFQSWERRLFEKNNLSTLSLVHNQISTFTSAMLQDFLGLENLYLLENDLSCDCNDVSAIFPYLNSSSTLGEAALITALSQPQTRCSLPTDLRFTSFLETINNLRDNDSCNDKFEFFLKIGLICGCLVVLVSLPIFYYLRWHIKYWIFLLRQAMSCYIFPKKTSPAQPGKYLYDAFVSYSNEDRGFVVRLVSMLENKAPRFRLCVFERDFAVGGVITANVVESLANSKRTILVLSDAFARSTWCQWEMNLAQHKRLFFKEDQHGPLIIIKIGEIMEKHMTPTLRYLTKTRIYLQWNSDPIKQKVFWEKLRSALAAPLNDQDDRPSLQHAVLTNGETVSNNRTTDIQNHTNDSIDV